MCDFFAEYLNPYLPTISDNYYSYNQETETRRKILFATVPGEGHITPLTGLAVHLKNAGYEVRWYTSVTGEEKIKKLQIPPFPLKKHSI